MKQLTLNQQAAALKTTVARVRRQHEINAACCKKTAIKAERIGKTTVAGHTVRQWYIMVENHLGIAASDPDALFPMKPLE